MPAVERATSHEGRQGLGHAQSRTLWVEDEEGGKKLVEALDSSARLAVDTEAAGFHRYSDRICLLQLSTESDTFVIDTLAFNPGSILAPALADPDRTVLLHGSDYDLRLLDRDLGLRVRSIVDTQVAAALSGEQQTGLSALLERHLGISLSKKYQRADWAQRPLSTEQLAYAAADTRSLGDLWDLLRERLVELGRLHWVEEEFELLEQIGWAGDEEPLDPVTRFTGARKLDLPTLEGLRAAWGWRDALARERDRAPFRIAEDRVLAEVATGRIDSTEELAGLRGISKTVARGPGAELLERVRSARATPVAEIAPYPRRSGGRADRPTREVEERFERLKAARNQRADELGLDRGLLVPNAALMEIARGAPGTMGELKALPSVKRWQVEAAGDSLLEAARNTKRPR
ncbi:MAG: HRDC domain-containing protein [Gemmatimonadota bacterium]